MLRSEDASRRPTAVIVPERRGRGSCWQSLGSRRENRRYFSALWEQQDPRNKAIVDIDLIGEHPRALLAAL